MQQVIEHLIAEGYPVKDFIADGNIHRFPLDAQDKRKSGWYKGHQNYVQDTGEGYYFVIYGSWREGMGETKKYCTLSKRLPPTQARAHKEQLAKAKSEAEAEREADYQRVATECESFWATLKGRGTSPYLVRKQIQGHDLGVGFHDSGHIYVPCIDIDDKLWCLEEIFPDGFKLSTKGGKRKGCFHVIGEIKETIYISEGFATTSSIHLATGDASVCSFGIGNLKNIAQIFKKKFPDKKIVICGDKNKSDRKSESEKLAEEAGKAIICPVVFPSFTSSEGDPTDFNDLHCREGLEEVKNQLTEKMSLEPIKLHGSEIVTTPFPDEDENGKRRGTIENVKEVLRRLNIIVRYNGISKEQEILIPGLVTSLDNRDNCTLAHIISWCERCRIPIGNLTSYLTALSDMNLYNPVKTWVESAPWDGVSRLKEFYNTVQATDIGLKEKLMKHWLISAIAAAYEPNGISAQGVLTFQGLPNAGKTRWFRSLCPSELRLDGLELIPSDKDSVIRAIGIWLGELGEIDSTFKKSDISALKAYITKDCDVIRLPYDRRKSKYPRRTVYFGSVNEEEFLYDPTGNRRFWVVKCQSINPDHNIDMQQLWAEILILYRAGERWYLTPEEIAELNAHNEQFQTMEPIEEAILTQFDWPDPRRQWMSSLAICKNIGMERPTIRDIRIVARAVQKASGETRRKSNGHWVYCIAPILNLVTPQYESIRRD